MCECNIVSSVFNNTVFIHWLFAAAIIEYFMSDGLHTENVPRESKKFVPGEQNRGKAILHIHGWSFPDALITNHGNYVKYYTFLFLWWLHSNYGKRDLATYCFPYVTLDIFCFYWFVHTSFNCGVIGYVIHTLCQLGQIHMKSTTLAQKVTLISPRYHWKGSAVN